MDVPQEVCAERHKTLDERFARDKDDIAETKCRMAKLEEVSIRMGQILDGHEKELDGHENRIAEIESKPAKRWDSLINTVLQWVVTAVLAAVLILK